MTALLGRVVVVTLITQIEPMVVTRTARKAAGVISCPGGPKDDKQRQRIADFGTKHSPPNRQIGHISYYATTASRLYFIPTPLLFKSGVAT